MTKDLSYHDLNKERGSEGNKAWVTNHMAQAESLGLIKGYGSW
jgi:hypothetical protein